MTRFEFTEQLRKALSGRVNHRIVNENVSYYENYIDTEIKKGRSERDVLESLGDPRLLAKTIIDTAGESGQFYGEEEERGQKRGIFGHVLRLPYWAVLLIICLVFLLVLKIVGLVIVTVMPIAIPVILICWLVRYFRRRQ